MDIKTQIKNLKNGNDDGASGKPSHKVVGDGYYWNKTLPVSDSEEEEEDECKDIDKEQPGRWSKKYSVFCSNSDRKKAKKRCEGFVNYYRNTIEHYKNLKDTNYLTIIIITIMILFFTYFVLNR